MQELNCHKCPYAGTDACITCKKGDQDFSKHTYIFDTYDAPAPDTTTSDPCTSLPEEVEDKLRKFMFQLFDLDCNELLLMKAIMNRMSLTEYATMMESTSKQNTTFSRHKAFQTRKRLLRKLGEEFAPALLTTLQKKELKKD